MVKVLSTSEVAAAMGISRPRVHQLRNEHPDFPEPVIERPRALFFAETAVRRWAEKHGYPWEAE
jgi:predicted DNA-binding transcriptional regulator AlpA